MMLASQKTNRDPYPWQTYWADGGRGGRYAEDVSALVTAARSCKFEPRPEFNNTPNPLLLGLRRAIERGVSADSIRYAFAACDANPPGHISREQIEHARRVFMRLGY